MTACHKVSISSSRFSKPCYPSSLISVPFMADNLHTCVHQLYFRAAPLILFLSCPDGFNVEYAPVTPQALLLCFKLHHSRTAIVSSTVTTMLGQLAMFVFDNLRSSKRITRRLLLASELESITLLGGTTRLPSSRTYACWETASVRLQLGYLHKTSALGSRAY
jgi:protein MON2